jgi:hypothetical protein
LRPAPLLGPLSTSVTTMFTPTSVDAIRAAPGPCVTLYQRPEIRAVESNFSLPWTRSDIDQEQAAASSVSQDLLSRRNRPHPHVSTAMGPPRTSTKFHSNDQMQTWEEAQTEEEDLRRAKDNEPPARVDSALQCSAVQGSPPRNRKLNVREVDEHDDYGGALLSMLERELLSTHKPFIPSFADCLQKRGSCKPTPVICQSHASYSHSQFQTIL